MKLKGLPGGKYATLNDAVDAVIWFAWVSLGEIEETAEEPSAMRILNHFPEWFELPRRKFVESKLIPPPKNNLRSLAAPFRSGDSWRATQEV